MSGGVAATRDAGRGSMVVAHVVASLLSLLYAWMISQTVYVTTAIQFVSPVAVIILVHIAFMAIAGRLVPGFSRVVFSRTLVTAGLNCIATFAAAVLAPTPAGADNGSLGVMLGLIGCLVVLGLVVGATALIIYGAIVGAIKLTMWLRGRSGGGPDAGNSRIFDASAVMLVMLVVVGASAEGVGDAMSFTRNDRVSSAYTVAASPEVVWRQVGKATSPDFPLPAMLHTIPRPVAVIVDEGAALGARRVVRFVGREGFGDLTLKVTRRTDSEAVFSAFSDTSPVAMWVRHRSLTFRVEASGKGTRLTVTADYDRLLAPAWFFRPYVRVAAYLAVDVLARDTKARAERFRNGSRIGSRSLVGLHR